MDCYLCARKHILPFSERAFLFVTGYSATLSRNLSQISPLSSLAIGRLTVGRREAKMAFSEGAGQTALAVLNQGPGRANGYEIKVGSASKSIEPSGLYFLSTFGCRVVLKQEVRFVLRVLRCKWMPCRKPDCPEFPSREPVLSEAALAYAKKIESDRKLDIGFLKRAGIIERPGLLSKNYRSH
jgi:hypothetical protein